MSISIKERMTKLGVKNVHLIKELRKHGLEVSPPEMSNVVNDVTMTPKSKIIRAECEKILNGLESEAV